MKTIEEMTWDELVDFCAGEILKGLIKGEFRSSIYQCLIYATRYQKKSRNKS